MPPDSFAYGCEVIPMNDYIIQREGNSTVWVARGTSHEGALRLWLGTRPSASRNGKFCVVQSGTSLVFPFKVKPSGFSIERCSD